MSNVTILLTDSWKDKLANDRVWAYGELKEFVVFAQQQIRAQLTPQPKSNEVLIYRDSTKSWWKAPDKGVTQNIEEAHYYDRATAEAFCKSDSGLSIQEIFTPKPSITYDRQTCLQGLYNPATNLEMPYWGVTPHGDGYEIGSANESIAHYDALIKRGYIFFPLEILRTEFKTIAEGEWKPIYGDTYCFCFFDLRISNYSEIKNISIHNNWDEQTRCFPSLPQMESFIASRKKEPKEELEYDYLFAQHENGKFGIDTQIQNLHTRLRALEQRDYRGEQGK